MKKSTIILSAIGLFSIFSGILAIKAQYKFLGKYKCSTRWTTNCPLIATTKATPTTTLYCTLISGTHCSVPLEVSINL